MAFFQKIKSYIVCLLCSLLFSACDSGTNIIGRSISKYDKKSFDAQLTLAKVNYNKGFYLDALEYAEKAHSLDPFSEQASVTLGYIYLSLAGFDPIKIIRNLSEQGKQEETGDDSSNIGGFLQTFSLLAPISESEFEQLGEVNTSVEDLPVIEPDCANKVRTLINSLNQANETIKIICNLVPAKLKINSDSRHKCRQVAYIPERINDISFLWALSHLMEAIILNSVFRYSTVDATQSNLELRFQRVTKSQVQSVAEVNNFIKELEALNQLVNKVFAINGDCSESGGQSQFTALINDMITVNRSFQFIDGMPNSISQSIERVMNQLENMSQVTSSADKKDATEQAFKASMNSIASDLSSKIDSLPEKLSC